MWVRGVLYCIGVISKISEQRIETMMSTGHRSSLVRSESVAGSSLRGMHKYVSLGHCWFPTEFTAHVVSAQTCWAELTLHSLHSFLSSLLSIPSASPLPWSRRANPRLQTVVGRYASCHTGSAWSLPVQLTVGSLSLLFDSPPPFTLN